MTGKTCFSCAAFCLFVSFVAGIYHAQISGNMKSLSSKIMSPLLESLLFFYWLYKIELIKSRCESGKKFMNPMKIEWFAFRTVCFFAFFGLSVTEAAWNHNAVSTVGAIREFFFISFVYFGSCTPPPGAENFVSKWIDALSGFLFGKLATASD